MKKREVKIKNIKFYFNYLVLIFCGSCLYLTSAQELSCCSKATGSCRNVCTQISLVTVGAEAAARENASQALIEFCPSGLTEFWSCINTTFSEAVKNERWVGRGCCNLAQYPVCRSACALGGSTEALQGFCRRSDEPEFYACIERQEEGEKCCNNVSNMTCRSVCRELFDKPGKQSSLKLYSSKGCFHQVPKCLKNAAESLIVDNPRQYLHCCNEARNTGCLDACRKTLHTATTVREILDSLEEKCERAFPHSPLWSCLLQSSPTKPSRLPLDIGKLSCCSRATSANCQAFCWRAFQADWEIGWNQLESNCLSSSSEGELRRCLEDADDPCEMGCSGLNFCSKFNNRPTSLFRTCSATADETAKWESDHWSRGGVIRGFSVPIHVHPSCPIEILQAATCLLQIRPCESKNHESRLCRDDCLELMSNCVDWSVTNGTETAFSLCSKISPPRTNMPCVSLRSFTESPKTPLIQEDITFPCKNHPCLDNEVCVVEPNIAGKSYSCQASCSLGKMSKLSVPLNTWVQIPRVDQIGCLRICQCTLNGLEKCRSLNCFNYNSCWVQDRFIEHRTNFYLECNPCHCFEGEVTCSRRSCGEYKSLSLPCDCPSHYVPVCGRMGVTYPSACLAKCSGLTANDVEFGSCSMRDPCKPNPCGTREKCLRKSRVCLSPIYKPCKQYECIAENCDRKEIESGPVCDRDNREHSSACALIKTGAILAYRGPCLRGCSLRGPVCGINGEVYSSECAAWAEKIAVDYYGYCVAVGVIAGETRKKCGDAVKCPSLGNSGCIGVVPPGACCPICGGAGRIYYSRKQLDRIYYIMEEEADKETVTLDALLTALGRQLEVPQCALRGSVTMEGDIFVVTQSTLKNPSEFQQKVCATEMEKLITRITERSPKIVTQVPLGSLTRAEIVHDFISSASLWRSTGPVVFLLSILVMYCW